MIKIIFVIILDTKTFSYAAIIILYIIATIKLRTLKTKNITIFLLFKR